MALIHGNINPLNALGVRRLAYMPLHFTVLKIQNPQHRGEEIDQWIYHNLNSRYCIKFRQCIDGNKKIVEVCEIGLEDEKEFTMLNLACPHLHKHTRN